MDEKAFTMRIQAATRDVITACGGLKRSADICGLSDSQLSRCQKSGGPDIITLVAAYRLEGDCGLHLITQAMAAAHGRSLSDPDAAGSPISSVMEHGAGLIAAAASAMNAISEAIKDGKVTPAEYENIDRQYAAAERKVAEGRNDFAAAKAGAPLRIVGGEA